MSKHLNEFRKNLFCTDHITNDHLKKLLGVLIIMYIIIFIVMAHYQDNFQELNETCIINCNTNTCKKIAYRSRGSNYYLTEDSIPYNCIFTIWELSHLIMHIFIGYYFNFGYSLGIGIIFEMYEKQYYKCESYLDILYNSIGGLFGVGLRTYTTL